MHWVLEGVLLLLLLLKLLLNHSGRAMRVMWIGGGGLRASCLIKDARVPSLRKK